MIPPKRLHHQKATGITLDLFLSEEDHCIIHLLKNTNCPKVPNATQMNSWKVRLFKPTNGSESQLEKNRQLPINKAGKKL